jgi:hypothetical protein
MIRFFYIIPRRKGCEALDAGVGGFIIEILFIIASLGGVCGLSVEVKCGFLLRPNRF